MERVTGKKNGKCPQLIINSTNYGEMGSGEMGSGLVS
jgi:hypothetical protein